MPNGWWRWRRKKLTLMVGFNRRFAPLYRELKTRLGTAASLRMDKHRTDSIGPHDLRFTLLDDYLHVVDTVLWLAGGEARLASGTLLTSESGEMCYAEHHFPPTNYKLPPVCTGAPEVSVNRSGRHRWRAV